MDTSSIFSQLVESGKDYQRKIALAKNTLETIHTSFCESIKPDLQKLGQYTQYLQVAQMLSAAASRSEAAKYRALENTAEVHVQLVKSALDVQHASYKICKKEQCDNIDKWGLELEKINGRLSTLQDF